MNDPTMIAIPWARLAELLRAETKLQALEDSGVDNWDWFENAIDDYENKIDGVYDANNVPTEHRHA